VQMVPGAESLQRPKCTSALFLVDNTYTPCRTQNNARAGIYAGHVLCTCAHWIVTSRRLIQLTSDDVGGLAVWSVAGWQVINVDDRRGEAGMRAR